MVRTKDGDGIKSNMIIMEVQKRSCLYDTNHPNYGDRSEKARSWEEVCQSVVPFWSSLGLNEKLAAGKEVQKRWRSIRDSYTKAYRQGKCTPAELCPPSSRKFHYHKQMAFLLRALQNKKPRYSQDKYESFSELSNSPQHQPEDNPKTIETIDKPLDLKFKPETQNKCSQTIDNDKRIDSILPEDHFDDDKLFMNSLTPLFKKMDDDTRLLCRIEVLKIIRYALQGHKSFDGLKSAEDSFFRNNLSGVLKEEVVEKDTRVEKVESKLSMTTRSADGSRPIRKRKNRSPSPLPVVAKKRGPGRPRKVRPPPSDSEEDHPGGPRAPPQSPGGRPRALRSPACDPPGGPRALRSPASDPPGRPRAPQSPACSELDERLSKATSIDQLPEHMFMKMYNLQAISKSTTEPVKIKTEPIDNTDQMS